MRYGDRRVETVLVINPCDGICEALSHAWPRVCIFVGTWNDAISIHNKGFSAADAIGLHHWQAQNVSYYEADIVIVLRAMHFSGIAREVLDSLMLNELGAENALVVTDSPADNVQIMVFGTHRIVTYRACMLRAKRDGTTVARLLTGFVEPDVLPLFDVGAGQFVPPSGVRYALRISGAATVSDRADLEGLVALDAEDWDVKRTSWALSSAENVTWIRYPRGLEKLTLYSHAVREADLADLACLRHVGGVGHGLLESLRLPASLESMEIYAFSFTALRDGDFSHCSRLGELADFALFMCVSLTRLRLPRDLNRIGVCACAGCTALEEVEVGVVREIAESAFEACPLARIACARGSVAELLPAIARSAAARVDVGGQVWCRTCALRKVEWNGGPLEAFVGLLVVDATSWIGGAVPSRAFSGCATLRTVHFSEAVVSVGEGAFQGCYNLTKFCAGRLQRLGAVAFFQCISLRAVVLDDVVAVPAAALGDCGLRWLWLPKAIAVGEQRLLACVDFRASACDRLVLTSARLRTLEWSALTLDLCGGPALLDARFGGMGFSAAAETARCFRQCCVFAETAATYERVGRPALPR